MSCHTSHAPATQSVTLAQSLPNQPTKREQGGWPAPGASSCPQEKALARPLGTDGLHLSRVRFPLGGFPASESASPLACPCAGRFCPIISVGIKRNCQERLGHHRKARLIQLSLCFPAVITLVINLCHLTVLHFEKRKWKEGWFQTNFHPSLKSQKRMSPMSASPFHTLGRSLARPRSRGVQGRGLQPPRPEGGFEAAGLQVPRGDPPGSSPGLRNTLHEPPEGPPARRPLPPRTVRAAGNVRRPDAARGFANDIITPKANKSVPASAPNPFSPHFIVSN